MGPGGAAPVPSDARWLNSQPPLKPHPNVAAAVGALLPEHGPDAPILLLGVTPELAVLPCQLLAVDRSPGMIARAWLGNSPTRQVVRADWRRMPLNDHSVAGAIGDFSFNVIRFGDDLQIVLEQVRRVVRPGGAIVVRFSTNPETGESAEQVCESALSGAATFHAFKLRLNMALARERDDWTVISEAVFARFQALFPDRARLAAASGWSVQTIDEIDRYAGNRDPHAYPTRSALASALPAWAGDHRFVETDGYPLAERCPLLVIRVP